jgi:hypothetical protein
VKTKPPAGNQILRADSSTAELPLFQGEDGGATPTSALHFVIRKITNKTAEQWVTRWHYSRRMPTGKNICYGLYANGQLYAVIVYGIGVNPYQAKFLGVKQVLEIKRMCRSEPALPYPLSRFIALTAKMVAKEYAHDCLIAFADPDHGHEGTVYKASGFRMHGMTNAEWHLEDEHGEKRHRRYAFRYARRNGKSVAESRADLKLKRVQTSPKYRWIRLAHLKTKPRHSIVSKGEISSNACDHESI